MHQINSPATEQGIAPVVKTLPHDYNVRAFLPGTPNTPAHTPLAPCVVASQRRTTDQLCVRSASLRGLAVCDKSNAGTLHDAADLLYDAAQELGYLRNSHDKLREALHEALLVMEANELDAGGCANIRAALRESEATP